MQRKCLLDQGSHSIYTECFVSTVYSLTGPAFSSFSSTYQPIISKFQVNFGEGEESNCPLTSGVLKLGCLLESPREGVKNPDTRSVGQDIKRHCAFQLPEDSRV